MLLIRPVLFPRLYISCLVSQNSHTCLRSQISYNGKPESQQFCMYNARNGYFKATKET